MANGKASLFILELTFNTVKLKHGRRVQLYSYVQQAPHVTSETSSRE